MGFLAEQGLHPDPAELVAFLEDLYEVNKTTNLTRITPEDAVALHVLDSLLPQDLFPTDSWVLDIGCGPGFPAWPLAWARPDLQVVGMDSVGKMHRFLSRHERANLAVAPLRAEEPKRREEMDVVTGRAVAPLGIQLELSAAYVRVGGYVIPFRTAAEEEDFVRIPAGQLGLKLVDVVVRTLPGRDLERAFPIYEKVRTTPKEFPRPWATMRQKPLRPQGTSAKTEPPSTPDSPSQES